LARRMVDSKLSDTKKKMLVLKRSGFSQAEIGKRILNAKQQPMTRQAVSKALASVRKEFLLENYEYTGEEF
ncbi:LuxR family transcriptional regulator, partial [Marinobacter sp. Z-F4-2]